MKYSREIQDLFWFKTSQTYFTKGNDQGLYNTPDSVDYSGQKKKSCLSDRIFHD